LRERAACREAARLLRAGVDGAIEGGTLTADLGGKASTSSFTQAAIAAMK